MIDSIKQLDLNEHYNYADYLLWKFKERVELFKGKILPMAAPNVNHQRISGKLYLTIGNFLMNKKCEVFHAPFDVRLPLPANKVTDHKVDTVVQPDLCVICDPKKLDKQSCISAPDLVIEILSPGNSSREMKDKFTLYEEAGVLEYWVVDPHRKTVFMYVLNQTTHHFVAVLPVWTNNDRLKSKVLKGLEIDLVGIFPEKEL